MTVFSLLTLEKPISLFLHLMYVNWNWIDAKKTSQRKWEAHIAWGLEAQLPPQNLKIY